METRKYTFGNVTFRITSPKPLKKDRRFEAFLSEGVSEEDFILEIFPPEPGMEIPPNIPMLQKREGNYIRIYMKVDILPGITISNLFSAAKTANLLPEKEAFILHCSYVLYEGKAILFCAPSETGKSTQAALWEKYRGTTTVNEDRAVIFKKSGIYHAGGCWATGHATTCLNITAPIEEIVLLGQGSENRVYSIGAVEMLQKILIQCSFDDEDRMQCLQIMNLVMDLLGKVSVVAFDCVKEESSVDELERYLWVKKSVL